jgi:hypothetical protein
MAVIRVPFSATAELQPPFMLDEDFSDPNGVKSVLYDTSSLQVAAKQDTVDVPDIGSVVLCVYHVVGTIQYICNAYPIVQSDTDDGVQQHMATFSNTAGNTAADCAGTSQSDVFGWISAKGSVHIDAAIGGSCVLIEAPDIESVIVENLAVANNPASSLAPACPDACGEELSRIVKWRGCFVITTSD